MNMQQTTPASKHPATLAVEQTTVTQARSSQLMPPVWFRHPMRLLCGIFLLYVIGFFWYFPNALTNYDEVCYVRQAVAFASGHSTVSVLDPLTGLKGQVFPSNYPPGTSALMAPYVGLAGWRGTFALGLLALGACIFFTARWIADSGGSPLFALVILGYLPTLVMARTAMSDVPSACLVAAGLWLFWPTDDRATGWRRFLAGLIAGFSLCLREPNPILFAFFFGGAVLRRERHILPLFFGGLLGSSSRFVAAYVVYGDPLFTKLHDYGFTGLFLKDNLLIYLTALLILIPGGLLAVLAYRGYRRPELIATVVFFTGMFTLYNYNASSSGGLKQWILSMRFLIPLVPIGAFALAHTVPRWYEASTRSFTAARKAKLQSAVREFVIASLAGLVLAGFLVNWTAATWSNTHQDVIRELYRHTDPRTPILADIQATVKFLNELYGPRTVAELNGMDTSKIQALVERNKVIEIVFFDRDDTDYWRMRAAENRALIQYLAAQCVSELTLEERFRSLGILRIWRLTPSSR
jgi:hypothetical protein